MKNLSQFKNQVARGFTLIEILVVLVILGIFATIMVRAQSGSSDGAIAMALERTADNIGNNLVLISQQCGTPTTAASNPLSGSNSLSDVLFKGSSMVAPAYTACYAQSNVVPMTTVGQVTSTAGVYSVNGFSLTLTGGGTAPLGNVFSSVPDAIVLQLARKYDKTLTALAASDTTSTVVQYSAATGGTRTLTILKQL